MLRLGVARLLQRLCVVSSLPWRRVSRNLSSTSCNTAVAIYVVPSVVGVVVLILIILCKRKKQERGCVIPVDLNVRSCVRLSVTDGAFVFLLAVLRSCSLSSILLCRLPLIRILEIRSVVYITGKNIFISEHVIKLSYITVT